MENESCSGRMVRPDQRKLVGDTTKMPIIGVEGLALSVTEHAKRMVAEKGFVPIKIVDVFQHPERITEVTKNPGQIRLIGNGLALVGRIEHGKFVLITVYQDQVLTPPRKDQLETPEGIRYASRYAAGLGRG